MDETRPRDVLAGHRASKLAADRIMLRYYPQAPAEPSDREMDEFYRGITLELRDIDWKRWLGH